MNDGQIRKGPQGRGLFPFLGMALFLMLVFFVTGLTNAESLRLEVIHVASGHLILDLPVEEGENLQIQYIHSVEGLPVYETFVIAEGKLTLDEVQWLSFGAGLGYTGQGELVLENEWVKIKDMKRYADPLFLRVGTVAEHRLIYRGQEFYLRDYVKGMELIRFSIGSRKRFGFGLG